MKKSALCCRSNSFNLIAYSGPGITYQNSYRTVVHVVQYNGRDISKCKTLRFIAGVSWSLIGHIS